MRQSKLEILQMEPADLPAVLAIERESFPSPWTESMFRSIMANAQVSCRVARMGDELAGYSVFGVAADECDLLNIATAGDMRYKGVATFLMQEMIDYVRPLGVTAIWLDVRVTNHVAQGLYRKFGFVATGTRKGYYPAAKPSGTSSSSTRSAGSRTRSYQREDEAPPSWRGEDALMMVLRLPPVSVD